VTHEAGIHAGNNCG